MITRYFYRFRYEVLPKLKREWKTALVAVLGSVIEVHDALIATGVLDLNPLIPLQYRPYVSALWPVLMLVLRRWRDKIVEQKILVLTKDSKPDVTVMVSDKKDK